MPHRREESKCFRRIWTTQAPLKIKVHIWISFHDSLLTMDNLAKRSIHITTSCMLCGVNQKLVAISFFIVFSPWNFGHQNEIAYLYPRGHLLHLFRVIGGFPISNKMKLTDGLCGHRTYMGGVARTESKSFLSEILLYCGAWGVRYYPW